MQGHVFGEKPALTRRRDGRVALAVSIQVTARAESRCHAGRDIVNVLPVNANLILNHDSAKRRI